VQAAQRAGQQRQAARILFMEQRGGVAAFVLGSLILIDTDVPGFEIARSLIVSIATIAAVTLLAIIWLAMRSRTTPVVSGVEEMTGMQGEALEEFAREGAVRVHGERWHARSSSPVTKGQTIMITRVDGLTLSVEPVSKRPPED
jgi:membrane-bound serine protease (ClpP class)